eukprot:216228_1
MRRTTTNSSYHGSHEYSTFSASTIRSSQPSDDHTNTLCKCICCLCRLSSSLILHPVGPFRCIWDMFVMLLLVYTSIEIPLTVSFGQSTLTAYVGLAVDCFLLIDIVLNFHTAYFDKYDHLRVVTNKRHICKNYLKHWFIIDLITCIPFQFLFDPAHFNGSSHGDMSGEFDYIKILRIFRLFRIIKILRFLRMLRIFDTFMKQFVNREMIIIIKMIKIICGMILFAHIAACCWWYTGSKTSPSWIDGIDKYDLRSPDIDTFTKYSYAWYWAVVTLFTTGYGDITATNTTEQWVCSVAILVGTCFFGYFIGTLTAYITEGDKVQSFRSDKLEEARSFCDKKKLPKELTRAVLIHIRYHCTYNYVFDEGEVLSLLPAHLQHDIHNSVAKQFLMHLKMFHHLSDYVIGLIAVKCKSISCNQGYRLYEIDDIAKEFYIQRTGKSSMYNKKGQKIQQLSRGSVCGEYSSFLFKKRTTKLECDTWSEFYSINIDDIRQILDVYYPKSSVSKWKAIQHHLREAYADNVNHSVHFDGFHRELCSLPEESVHLFETESQHTPIPPIAFADIDHEEEQIALFAPVTIELQRPQSYEYSSAAHHTHAAKGTRIKMKQEEEKDLETSVRPTKIQEQTQTENVGDKETKRFVKSFRTRSDLRHSKIMAHSEKHRASESTGNTAMKGRVSSTVELGKGDRSHVTFIPQSQDTPANALAAEDLDDSECSFFSSVSNNSDDEKKAFKSSKGTNSGGKRKKTSVTRKGKGKFRRRNRTTVTTKLKASGHASSPRNRKILGGIKRTKSDTIGTKTCDTDVVLEMPTPNDLFGQRSLMSFDESFLLAALNKQCTLSVSPGPDANNEDSQSAHEEKTYTKPKDIAINSDKSNNLHDEPITPLYMQVIRSNSVLDLHAPRAQSGHQLENPFDVSDMDKTEQNI